MSKLDFSKCQCSQAGWCGLFNKEMTSNPPNWQWCQGLSPEQREEYHNQQSKKVRTLRQAIKRGRVTLVNFHDHLPEQTSDYAICVIPANDSALALLDLTRNNIQKYAKKCGADYIELRGDQHPDWPMANKFRVHQVAKKYKKTLYLDCDIVVQENSPNIFNLTPDDKISAFDEYSVWVDKKDSSWIHTEQDLIVQKVLQPPLKQKYIDNGKFIAPEMMINGGVMVIPQSVADYYKQPEFVYPRLWCFDQNWLTLTLPKDKFYNLPQEFNLEYVDKDFFEKYKDAHFIHVNNLSKNETLRLNTIHSLIEGQELYNLPKYEEMIRLGWVKTLPETKYVKPRLIEDDVPEPKSRLAVCTINTSDYTDRQLAATRDRIIAYAEMCGADYVELKDDKFPEYPMFNKYRLYNVTRLYDKTLYVDCDIVIQDNAPDIFKETPDDKISAHIERDYLDEHCTYYIMEHTGIVKSRLTDNPLRQEESIDFINGGVLVIPRCQANSYQMPDFDFPAAWCFDQIYLGIELDNESFNELGNKWNCSFKHSTFKEFSDNAHFLHFNNPTSTRIPSLNWYANKKFEGFYSEFGCIPTTECAHHRSGWNHICKRLFDSSSDKGIYLDATLENTFSWKEKWYKQVYHVPYQMPWVGFLHNPPNSPDWFHTNKDFFYGSFDEIMNEDSFKRSIDKCQGIFTLSSYLADHVKERTGLPTLSFKLPIIGSCPQWNLDRAAENKEITMIGYWHRKFQNFLSLNTRNKKSFLGGLRKPLEHWMHLEAQKFNVNFNIEDFTIYEPMVNKKYDEKLTEIVVFLDFWDTAANTSLMDCIARNTPVIICRHPAVVEYLGEDYPLYFDNYQEAQAIANDFDKIILGHQYLKNMDKSKFSEEYFFERLGAWNDLIKR